jgi:hypothetical protein
MVPQRRVVALERVEAAAEPRLRAAQGREIVEVLDLMMPVELREQAPQPRRRAHRELERRDLPSAVLVDR